MGAISTHTHQKKKKKPLFYQIKMEENITNFFLSLYKYITHIINRVMLTNALRILVKNLVKKSFYGKKKKLMFR